MANIHLYTNKQSDKSGGEITIVDDKYWAEIDSFPSLAKRKLGWQLCGWGYAFCTKDKIRINLANFVYNIEHPNYNGLIDHVNRIKLDNRIENLRPATKQQNDTNKSEQSNNSSGYRGVFWDKSKNLWLASIKVNNKQIFLGRYKNRDDAARRYNCAAVEYFGEFAVLNDVTPLFTTYIPKYPCK